MLLGAFGALLILPYCLSSLQAEIIAEVNSPSAATAVVTTMQEGAAAGTLVLANLPVLGVSDATAMISTGAMIQSISPNIAESGAPTTITIEGNPSYPAFEESTTRVLVSGTVVIPVYLSTTRLKVRINSAAGRRAASTSSPLTLMVLNGAGVKLMYQYNSSTVTVRGCGPTSGRKVGGYGGGGLVTVTVSGMPQILALPDIDQAAFRCRFGVEDVTPEAEPLEESGSIQCLPPASNLAGPVEVSEHASSEWSLLAIEGQHSPTNSSVQAY